MHTENEAHVTDGIAFNYTLRQPRGIAGLISPWNLPLYLLTWKIAPAIACGNTAVAKPSELTPMTAYLLCEIVRGAGLPPGVLNVVHGTGPRVWMWTISTSLNPSAAASIRLTSSRGTAAPEPRNTRDPGRMMRLQTSFDVPRGCTVPT